jgi:serine/threonine-protein kinase
MFACPICRVVLERGGACPEDGAELDAIELAPVPRQLQRQFRVDRPYAHGDTGTLHVARDPASGSFGLLKVLRLRTNASHAARDGLLRQLNRQTSLASASPCLAAPRQAGVTEGVTWYFREWIDGRSLRSHLADTGPLSMSDTMVVVAQVATALDRLHERTLVHRAVRPGHVLLRTLTSGHEVPEAVLIDAGMVGEDERGSAFDDLGDVFYMSPEQASGNVANFRSDLYSLGCVFYEALCGVPPFDGETAEQVLAGHLHVEPNIPHDALPGAVSGLLAKMLAKLPSDRPGSARAVVRDLDAFLPDGWSTTVRPSTAPPARFASQPPPALRAVTLAPGPVVGAPRVAPLTRTATDDVARASESDVPIDLVAPRSQPPAARSSAAPPMAMPAPAIPIGRSSVPAHARMSGPVAAATALARPVPLPTTDVPGIDLPAPQPVPLPAPPAAAPVVARRADPPSLKLRLEEQMFSAHDDDDSVDLKALGIPRPPRRLPWLATGFALGCLATAGALWGAANTGYYQYVTDTMTTHLAVPPQQLAPRGYALPPSPILTQTADDSLDAGVGHMAGASDGGIGGLDSAIAPGSMLDGGAPDGSVRDGAVSDGGPGDEDDAGIDELAEENANEDEAPPALTQAERLAARRTALRARRATAMRATAMRAAAMPAASMQTPAMSGADNGFDDFLL